jgi:hypothetical protein
LFEKIGEKNIDFVGICLIRYERKKKILLEFVWKDMREKIHILLEFV